ncbi:MAG: acriflavin resistance protein [Gemmatimonadetes bacterium]|nr:acriflavin resistance protein [Gemmatimonadota bacterium]
MILTDFAIRKRVTVYVLVVLLVMMGAYGYATLPREAAPDITIPFIVTTTVYVGASPADVETLVTRKIEKKLQGLEDVKEMRSTSAEGVSTITLEFEASLDVDESLQKVKDKVDLAKQDLPDDAEDPIVSEVNFSNIPIMIVNVSGDYGLVRLKEVAEDLSDELETISGVLEVQLAGGLEREVQVDVDPDRLTVYQLSLQDVVEAIQRENVTLPGGSLDLGGYNYSVRVPGEVESVEEIADFVIKGDGGRPVYIRDVAEVTYGFADRSSYARLNGQSCVSLSVIKRSGENLIEISDRVKAILSQMESVLPTGTVTTVQGDQSTNIRMMVRDLENNILSGLILVVAVLFFFMGFRNAVFAGIAIPLSMLISFVVIDAMEMTLNMVVLFSLILALGMLVDNAIVIVENIYRHVQSGKPNDEGSSVGTGEVAVPVIASTLTTLCAFAPMIFWPGMMGEFMKYLPITLIITLASSLLVGLVMNPTFCASFMRVDREDARSEQLLGVLGRYQRVLDGALDHPFRTMAFSGLSLVLVVILYGFFGRGVEFFPDVDPRKAYVDVRAPSGTRLETSDRIVKQIEAMLANVAEVDTYVATVGSSSDPEDFSEGGGTPHKSRVTVDFVAEEDRSRTGFEIIDELREKLAEVTGAEVEIEKEREGPPSGPPINIELVGDSFDTLGDLAARVRRIVEEVPGVVDLKDDYDKGRPEVRIQIDREAAALSGLDTRRIASTVRTAVYGSEASEFRAGEDDHDIWVRLRSDRRSRLADLETLIVEKDGKQIPLGSVARVETGGGLGSIKRKDMKRVVSVSGKVVGRTTDAALADCQAALADFELLPGYQILYTGETEDQNEAEAFLTNAFIVAVFMIALVLITQFDSVALPFVVLTSVILSLVGVLIGLMVTATPFGVLMTGIGVISLAGVVVNNAIVLIDYIQRLRREGMEPREAIVVAARTRFRPVIMTAITTILGLIPLATGISFDFFSFSWEIGGRSSEWWGPMGIAVVFGLAFATILTLVVVPVMVQLIWRWTERKRPVAMAAAAD